MKNNFKLMKDIHEHTKVTPQMRQQALIDLVKHINGMNNIFYFYFFNKILLFYKTNLYKFVDF